jgi:hypothetical protein
MVVRRCEANQIASPFEVRRLVFVDAARPFQPVLEALYFTRVRAGVAQHLAAPVHESI